MNTSNYDTILKKLKKLPVDQFHVNFMAYPFPHNLAREFFLEHEEYTHLIVCPQDLEPPTLQEYEELIQTVKDTNHDVISCVCNVEREGHPNHSKWAITKELPSKDKHKRYYHWVPQSMKKIGLMKVKFQGLVFCVISRRIIQRRTIDGEWFFKGTIFPSTGRFDCPPDLTFSHVCHDNDIEQWAHTDIRLIHHVNHKPSMIGKIPSSTNFIRYHDNQ